MLKTDGAALQIDSVHTRAICDEIGDRLRGMLRRQIGNELPPQLKDLMEQLARLDDQVAPSIIPTLDEMANRQRTFEHIVSSEGSTVPAVGRDPVAVSSR